MIFSLLIAQSQTCLLRNFFSNLLKSRQGTKGCVFFCFQSLATLGLGCLGCLASYFLFFNSHDTCSHWPLASYFLVFQFFFLSILSSCLSSLSPINILIFLVSHNRKHTVSSLLLEYCSLSSSFYSSETLKQNFFKFHFTKGKGHNICLKHEERGIMIILKKKLP